MFVCAFLGGRAIAAKADAGDRVAVHATSVDAAPRENAGVGGDGAAPALCEGETSAEDLEQSNASARSRGLSGDSARRGGCRPGIGTARVVADPSLVVANVADLIRLCRLLL